MFGGAPDSRRIPAEGVLHVFRHLRPGQVRGASWFAPVILKMKEFDEYDDAQLMKQKIAACLAVITSDVTGNGPLLGAGDSEDPTVDSLEPGMILNVAPGRTVEVVQPPSVREFADFASITLRAIAAGLGVTYEDLTGDYTNLPFSAARMSRLRHWARVDDWRWQTLIPQFCAPAWGWAMQAAAIMRRVEGAPTPVWTAPPPPMLDPTAEGAAYKGLVRIGALSWPEMVRERGYDPEDVLEEIAEWNAKLDDAGVVLDSDPRKLSAQGQEQPSETRPEEPQEPAMPKKPMPEAEMDE